MATKQPSAAELQAIQRAQNEQFMALSFEQPIKGNSQGSVDYGQGRVIVHYAPVIQGAWATKVTIRHNLEVTTTGTTGTITPNALYPYSFSKDFRLDFGSKQIQARPHIAKILDEMEGYARTLQDKVERDENTNVSSMLHTVPTTFAVDETYPVKFDITLDLNQLHPQSIPGLLPIFGNGVNVTSNVTLPSAIVGPDPMDNVFSVTGDAGVTVSGTIEVFFHYRNHISMSTVQALQPNVSGLPTVQIIQLPTVSPLTAGNWNAMNFRNPYPFAKLINYIVDGKSSTTLCKADNVLGYALDQAENPNSAFVEYSELTGGTSMLYKEYRSRFGRDFQDGIIVFDATTQNVANVSAKQGSAYLNVTGQGYPSGRQRFKVGSTSNANGISPRIEAYGIILNPEGIKAQ